MAKKRIQEPWFPLSCTFYVNEKIQDAGAAYKLAEQKLTF